MVHQITLVLAATRLHILCAAFAMSASIQIGFGDEVAVDEIQVDDAEPYENIDAEAYVEPIDESQGMEDPIGESSEVIEIDNVEDGCEVCGQAKQSCPGVCRDPGHPKKPKRTLPGDIDEGDCPAKRYRMDDRLRSGDPDCVYKWAVPSITEKYSAWYSGGGAAFKGRGRTAEEGTWGLDYSGLFGHARTWMNYTCGKYQGGEGAYEGEHVKLMKKLHAGH